MPRKTRTKAKARTAADRKTKGMSPIIQTGVVFLIVAAMALLAFAFKNYTP